MARIRSIDFLPEIFQTPINRQFLSATLDQLIQEPKFQKTQGFIGRKVGPGVNPDDRYVIEPTKSRNDYQLEPGVVGLKPDTSDINDVITYPGISDAFAMQGAFTNNSDRLYSSEYYSWDPFVDFDKFVNYQQYYWLPNGPDQVDVSATTIPLTDNFVVTRENGVYNFSGQAGNNPVLTLVRGGNYTFQVAQNTKEEVNYRVTNTDTSAYIIDYAPNPTLTLVRGNTYTFTLSLTGIFPFYIKTQASLGNTNLWSEGVINNGATVGTITFTVPQDAPNTLFYSASTEFNMRGSFKIVNADAGTGPGFWIQTDPGVNGRLPSAPNISSRDVLGVTNNGEDLGTIQFNVPYNTAQNFYYSLNSIPNVGFITNLRFDQINGQPVDEFLATTGGIDGILDINGRTLVFQTQTDGWGSVPPSNWYNVWKINFVDVLGVQVIQLDSILTVNNLEKFAILFGTQYASTSWYKTAEGVFAQIPLLTAVNDLLFYQDGTDPEIFGQIRLIDIEDVPVLRISDIIDRKNYTSPNGVVFTNGLKVIFRGEVEPASYQNVDYYVEGVGKAIKLLPVSNFITPEIYVEEEYAIIGITDSALGGPPLPDYLTINRASPDLNPWTRSNRWFHIEVINATAIYNNTVPVVDNLQRGRRPILEFRAGTKLFDFGTEGKQPINVIDFNETDALSNINGTIAYGFDGYEFVEGTRVIFAADLDPNVRNKIYEVQFITPDTEPPLILQPIINLVPASDATVLINQSVVCLSGDTLQGKNFYFDGVEWIPAQNKTARIQAPLFDIYDSTGISFGNLVKYPSTTFKGSKLLSYASGGGVPDPELGLIIKYLNVTNIGDIVFNNDLYTDTFVYVRDAESTTLNISEGFVRQYANRIDYIRELGWQTAVTPSLARQQFEFTYDGTPLRLDVQVITSTVVPAIQLYINSNFISIDKYTVTTTSNTTTITLLDVYPPGSGIEVLALSTQVSTQGFYQVPINLSNNPLNANSPELTLGTVRSHYNSLAENLIALQGPVNGANNTRDLGDIVPYGLEILQQSAPLTLTGYFARNLQYDIFASIEYNNREYIKFKTLLLDTVIRNEYPNQTVAQILDSAISDITRGRTDLNPFYWSDMLPSKEIYTQTTNTITPISPTVFDLTQTYDFTSANFKGLLVYLTRTPSVPYAEPITKLLLRGIDYVVSPDGPTLTILVPLEVGDVVAIQEYTSTAGNFVPNTPTKMGLYPKFVPQVFLDTTFVNPVPVIQGHDGSITVAFSDIRDNILLEFEKRIYNNIKTDGNPVPLTAEDVIPGEFRTTDYTQSEITAILGESFLSWVGWNKLDYKAQEYIVGNPFTYNYSSAGSKLTDNSTISNITEAPLLGAWKGIYRYFYDTISPNTTPWEMLGLSEKPDWWENRYGPAPYTSDNLVLWDDLEAGLVSDPIAPYIVPKYRRPGLTKVIPVGTEGQLLAPITSVVGLSDPTAWKKSWTVGDGGPVEASWWTSSSYPFAVMRLLALTKPAEFFSLFADRDLYRYDFELGQFLYNGRYRLDANGLQIYGKLSSSATGVSKASYINWIVDYNQQLGRNSTDRLTDDLANLDVRLCYRMASFTNKQYIKIFTEKSSPNSQNSSLLLPDESYNLLLYKNQPFSEIIYSALIIERVETGYAIYGYSTTEPYFNILASFSSGALQTVTGGGATVRVPTQYTNNVVQVPYGFVFINTTMVVDFILSYGAYLESQGLIFTGSENGYPLDWKQMASEFLYFSQQGWATGTLINLNPVADRLTAYKAGAVVDTIESLTPENMLLDQNRTVLPTRELIVDRNENTFTIRSATTQTIAYLKLRFTNYEHMIVLDNVSIFADLIYDPTTGARQNRLRLAGSTSTDWNGQLDAQGFILNQHNVLEWQSNRRYTKGEIVLYKNTYWSAQTIIQPKLEFNYNDWVTADYQLVQEGLLPNIPNKADQLANSYNTYSANLERDNDLLSYGLIGFRPRQYMAALNLDDVSQVNIYQQFLGTKGTIRSAELFTRADLGKESGEYNIYENWGILAATYGANANRSFFELRLFENLLQSNPSIVQVVVTGEQSDADQAILLSDVWRESYKLTSPEILPTAYATITDSALPNAGYVNINDVDITVFSIDDPSSIAANIEIVGIGTIIWVAKINSYDWDIYRCERVPGIVTQISDNLNDTSVAQFSAAHNLEVGDLIIIRYFSDAVNGVYRVLAVPGIQQVIISFSFVGSNQSSVSGTGLAFYLQTARVAQASDIANLPFANSLVPGVKAWVDNDGSGHWEVLEKQDPFTSFVRLDTKLLFSNSQYGYSIAQSVDHSVALIGAPGINSDAGSVYTYRRDSTDNYAFNINLVLNAVGTVGFGTSLSFGSDSWGVVGAPASLGNVGYSTVLYQVPGTNDFLFSQVLVLPALQSDQFGAAVAISADERWMYIGAPAANEVHAYARVDIQPQTIVYTTDGVTDTYNYSDFLEINFLYPNQIIVALENVLSGDNVDLVYAINYTLTDTSVILYSTPSAGLRLTITRRQTTQVDSNTYYGILQSSTSGLGANAVFTVNVTRGDYYPTIIVTGLDYAAGDTITILGTVLGGAAPANNLVITVLTVTPGGGIGTFDFTGSGVGTNATFSLTPYLYTATNIYSFTVIVNSILQRPYIDYTFNPTGQQLTFLILPPPGAIISAASASYWQYVQALTTTGLDVDARFGTSVTTTTDGRTVLIGSSYDDAVAGQQQTVSNAGAVYAIDRSVVRYLVDDAGQTTYTIPGTFQGPISVILNNTFLTNTDQFINGQFTVTGSSIVLSTNVVLTVGDILEIETNQFQQIQKVVANAPTDEAAFGAAVKICVNDCSLYIGSPLASNTNPQEGSVQRNVNQSRSYGVITSDNANPVLNTGDTIRINNSEVAVPASPNNNITGLIAAINASGIPNIVATATPNVVLVGDGFDRTFNVGTVYSSTPSYNPLVYVDDVEQTYGVDYVYNNTTEEITFLLGAPVYTANIVVVSGRMTLNIVNPAAALTGNKLTVLPGTVGTAFDDIGWVTYYFAQTIYSPNPVDYAYFGSSLDIDTSAVNLVVGAPNGNIYEPVTFDNGTTYFDDRSTTFFSPVINSGVAYTFDYLPSASSSITNPGAFVFGQQVYDDTIVNGDRFGAGLSYRGGRLLIGAPGKDLNNTTVNNGVVSIFSNPTDAPAWKRIYFQQPAVKIDQINSVFMYDRLTSAKQSYFDYIDPLQGKILGAARRNIDYVGAVDPADYNTGSVHNNGNSWAAEHVGEIWWDTDTVRFIDPNQDSIVYSSRRWGQVFPGSSVDIYQWVASKDAPVNYTGPGIALSTTSYTVSSKLNQYNIFETIYYFWVRGLTTIATGSGKTLSTTGIASYIEDPRGSGIPYIAALSASTVAMYNAFDLISASDTILHIEFDRQITDANIHQEYQLIASGKADAFLNDNLYRKLQDSFCGTNAAGASVPDPLLSPAERYGVQFRPRQSMFVDRFTALENYLVRANRIFAAYPIVESRSLALLNSSEPEPQQGSTTWNKRVPNIEVLSFQDLYEVPLGYRYLVVSDSTQNGLWTIYEVEDGLIPGERTLNLVRVQNFDTRRYWNYIDWYLPGYNSTITPVAEVPTYSALRTLTLDQAAVGRSVKVTANAQGKFEIYLRTGIDPIRGWERVGLEDGTIAIKEDIWNYAVGNFGFDIEVFDAQYFDQEPTIETRQIIRAINEELFIDDLAIERNLGLMLMFEYIYSEFSAPEWLIKTSLIDVDHQIRALKPYQNYLRDNQSFVLDYIQEVKPYHVQVREFNLTYYTAPGDETFFGDITDYDVPAYYNYDLVTPQFISPVLTPYTQAGSTIQSNRSDTPPNAELWTLNPWDQWFNNYLLQLQGVSIVRGGAGYTVPPTVYVDGVAAPTWQAVIGSNTAVIGVIVGDTLSGYTTTPVIRLVGGNGSNALAVAIMGNDLVRSFRTVLKYDRYQYSSTIIEWQANTTYAAGTEVRYLDKVWTANATVNSPIFELDQWTVVPAGDLSGVDRTMGMYVPTVNQPGLSLPLLIDGVDYPGVQVFGPLFSQNTGYDVGNFDINPYDNISYGPEGRPTYDPAILNAIYASQYLDLYLGVLPAPAYDGEPPNRPNAVVVAGGEYIDTYSSHAPEELVPGSEFDTLDFRVYTRSGADWDGRGHGFPQADIKYTFDNDNPTLSWAGLVPEPDSIVVTNLTTGQVLDLNVDYTADWINQTVTILPDTFKNVSALDTEIIVISVYGLGGGNQLFEQEYNGAEVGNVLDVPVAYSEIQEFAIFVDGFVTNEYTFAPQYAGVGVTTIYNPVGSDGTTLEVGSTVGIQIGSLIVGVGFTSNQTVVDKLGPTTLTISANPTTQPDGFLTFLDNTGQTRITFDNTYTSDETLSVTAIGPTTVNNVNIDYSWSTPQTQYIVATPDTLEYELTNSVEYTNPVNLIVTVNGLRARTAAGIDYYGDGVVRDYPVAGRLGFNQQFILDSEVVVYLDDIVQTLNVDYIVQPYDLDNPYQGRRVVTFTVAPAVGVRILLAVTTQTQCEVVDSRIVFNPVFGLYPPAGSIIAVTTWNDTRQQDLLTQVWVGPTEAGSIIVEGYSSTDYSTGDLNNEPGSYDYSSGTIIAEVNDFQLGRVVTNPDRLWVTVNGRRLYYGFGFTIVNEELILSSGVIGAATVVMVTQVTENVVPEPMAFRIFQDMRGVQATYRITPATTTTITQAISSVSDIVFVEDASALGQPNVENNIWGVLTVGGERIMYRERDTVNNTVSSLLRGTAGTGAAAHEVGEIVYDMGRENLLPEEYQNYVVSDSTLADGTNTVFVAENIDIASEDSTIRDETVEVYVGGTRVMSGYTITNDNPVVISFTNAPPAGELVTILVRRGVTWYDRGVDSASNGVALQDATNQAARFLRGQ